MNSTYKIEGYDKNKHLTMGTSFIIGSPTYEGSKYFFYVLVTAKHVIEDIDGDFAFLNLRYKIDSNTYKPVWWQINIRNGNDKLWVTHEDSTIDIAAIYINLPDSFKLYFQDYFLPYNMLGNDSLLRIINLHPGDELRCIGFPLGLESNIFGFPILRSGRISSYPILPTKIVRQILIDMNVFNGNSGSPVYFCPENSRVVNGNIEFGGPPIIIGLLTELIAQSSSFQLPNLSVTQYVSLNIGVIIPSIFIKETIDRLQKKQ